MPSLKFINAAENMPGAVSISSQRLDLYVKVVRFFC